MKSHSLIPGKRSLRVEPELEGRTLTVHVKMSRDLRRYFRKDSLYLRYEQDISAGPGLLGVPAVALLLPLAWLTGSNLHISRLDRNFASAAEALQQEYRRLYPLIPFGTEVLADELVDSPVNPEGSALLFSGGLDATYSFYANRHLEPRLVEIFGTEFPLTDLKYLDRVKDETRAFAARHRVPVSFVYTDFAYFFDHRAISHRFVPVREGLNGDLWKGMGYSLGFLSTMAPLSAGRFDHAIISAWSDQEQANRMREHPEASSPGVDEHIAWSNLRVEHHGCLHRHEKASELQDWLPGQRIRVCWLWNEARNIDNAMNCNRCEKCARTIVALAIGGVDPETCGFTINEETVAFIRNLLEQRRFPNSHMAMFWAPMQSQLPEQSEGEMFGLRQFLEWFRNFDLGDGVDTRNPTWLIDYFYHKLPYRLSVTVRTAYYAIRGEPKWMNLPEPESTGNVEDNSPPSAGGQNQ